MKVAGAAGLEPVTSAVTGQRSNQLSYAPAMGNANVEKHFAPVKPKSGNIRAADAKEVGVGNPAEETYCYPNDPILEKRRRLSTSVMNKDSPPVPRQKRKRRAGSKPGAKHSAHPCLDKARLRLHAGNDGF